MANLSYEPFSREPEYVEVNRLFVESLNLRGDSRVLDLACGTGTLSSIICSKSNSKSCADEGIPADRRASIIGVDICHESLILAHRFLAQAEKATNPAVYCLEATATSLPLRSNSMDAVIIGNAIQLFEEKDKLISEASRVLAENGILAFNTSFYAGTFVPGTERFYLRWVQEALRYIQDKDTDGGKVGWGRTPRKRSAGKAAFSNPWLSRHEYERLLVRNGFEVESVVERTVVLTRQGFEAIGSYAGLACVLLNGYQVDLACEALARSVGPALSAVGMKLVPRYWIEFISRKKEVK
jgi:ubiquinone/menaquinone biosynthesis C-methylase UbiE